MNITDLEIPYSCRFFPGLLPLLGQKMYDQVLDRYDELVTFQDWPENQLLQYHLVEGILPGLAVYQIYLDSRMAKPEAVEGVKELLCRLFDNQRISMQRIGRIPFVYSILRLGIKPVMKQYPVEGWSIEWKHNNSKSVQFNMHRCFYYETLKKYEAAELTAAFCAVDDLIYGNMSKHILWQRSQTIGRGAELCDFSFIKA